jgi:hypothetical protein
MACELLDSAQARWRAASARHLVALVCARHGAPLNTATEPITTAARQGILDPVQPDKEGNRS